MSQILETLFLGSYSNAKDREFLKRNGITHIVSVGSELKKEFPDHFKYLHIPAYDVPGYKLNAHFDTIADFIHNAIEEEKGKVFVHCLMGISRSSSSIIAYLTKYHKMHPNYARVYVKSKRDMIHPNPGFAQQLEQYARLLGITEKNCNKQPIIVKVSKSISTVTQEECKRPEIEEKITLTTSVPVLNVNLEETNGLIVEYSCAKCKTVLFNTKDIEHEKGSYICSEIYLKTVTWLGNSKTSTAKIYCPNKKCDSVLGFSNKNGGKCSCGKLIDTVHAVYPLKVNAQEKSQTNNKKL